MRMEQELVAMRKATAKVLRETRQAKRISLRKLANGVRLSPGALYQLERGKSWQSRTARRVARFLDRTAA